MIKLENITKTYPNGFEAVRGVSMDIAEGEFMVLVGPSGCGKTTILRMVAGLEDITGGALKIDDRVVNYVSPKDRDIAMVFQNYALFPHMTVGQNIGIALKLRKTPKKEIADKTVDVAKILGLGESLDRKPGQLSGGQRQRVAMGRAIVRTPKAFLMDEPLSNLDAKLRVQMRAEVRRLQRRLNVTTVYVTHDQVEAMTMGDRVAVMRDGLVQQIDDPQSIYDRPVNLFVAAFIGSPAMNLYEATLSDNARALKMGAQEIHLPGSVLADHAGLVALGGKTIVVGFRPEHLYVVPGEGEQTIEADVNLVEALGSELLVHFSIDAHKVKAEGTEEEEEQLESAGAGVARVDPRTIVTAGQRRRFGIDPSQMHFFDKASGVAL